MSKATKIVLGTVGVSAVLAVGIPAAAYFGWQYRFELEAAVRRIQL